LPLTAATTSAAAAGQASLENSRFGPISPIPISPGAFAPGTVASGAVDALPHDSKRVLAGVLAILLGFVGVHKFVLGYREAGAVMLLVTFIGGLCTSGLSILAAWVVGVIEGIVYLSKSDSEFVREYQVGRREWF
jgi:TM2 domain-containing membrane protein YozV